MDGRMVRMGEWMNEMMCISLASERLEGFYSYSIFRSSSITD
jgi:hypothetical protein